MRWSSLVKLLLGVILAIAILMGGGVATALYFMFKVTTPPPKPTFANDKPSLTQPSRDSKTAKRTILSAKQPNATPNSTESSKPLETGAYKARVTWSQGLSLRSEPNLDAERTGSAAYNQLIVVLGESADKTWQRVRLEDGEQQGWIKAGNIQKEEQ